MEGPYIAIVKAKSGEALASQHFMNLNEAIRWLRQIERQSPMGGIADQLCIYESSQLIWRAKTVGPNRQKALLQNALRIIAQVITAKDDD